jgi:hypothetical protein
LELGWVNVFTNLVASPEYVAEYATKCDAEYDPDMGADQSNNRPCSSDNARYDVAVLGECLQYWDGSASAFTFAMLMKGTRNMSRIAGGYLKWLIAALLLSAMTSRAYAQPALSSAYSVEQYSQSGLTFNLTYAKVYRANTHLNLRINVVSNPASLCTLQGFLDFHYVLLDQSSAVVKPVAIDPNSPPPDQTHAIIPPIDPTPCGHRKAMTFVVSLAWLYPHLQPGTYQLKVTYAPRGGAHPIDITPITFSVSSTDGDMGAIY